MLAPVRTFSHIGVFERKCSLLITSFMVQFVRTYCSVQERTTKAHDEEQSLLWGILAHHIIEHLSLSLLGSSLYLLSCSCSLVKLLFPLSPSTWSVLGCSVLPLLVTNALSVLDSLRPYLARISLRFSARSVFLLACDSSLLAL